MSEPKLENCDRSEKLELDGSIDSMPPNPKHSGFMSASGDLPTPPFGHPSVRVASACAEDGICRREIIDYERYLKELARKLRQNMTLGEVLLWQRLKRKQMRGYDGEKAKVNDDIRQERLESLGVRFLRFTDADVKRNMEMVVDSIASGTLRERALDR
jgi:very-short-patch-repair endonuclease